MTGLVVVLDLAGQRIADLEDRVAGLEQALAAERAQREALARTLATLRGDTPHLRPPTPDDGENDPHGPAPPY